MKYFVIVIFLLTLLSCNVKYVNKQEVNMAVQAELEKYFECNCVKGYKDNNHLYVEVKNSPLIINKYKENPDSFNSDYYASFASLMIAESLKGTDIDTFHIEIAFNAGITQISRSLSYVASVNIDIADKIALAPKYCEAASKGNFDTAKKYLNPALIDFLSETKVDTLIQEFQDFGEITDLTLLNYWHDDKHNLLYAIFRISFDSTKHGRFGFNFPLNGPKQINGYELLKQ